MVVSLPMGVAARRRPRAPQPGSVDQVSRWFETAIAFACLCLCGCETAIAFAGEKWVFLACFSVAEVPLVSTVAVRGASGGDGGFTLACISGGRGVIGFNVATSPRPVRDVCRPARPGVGCVREKVRPASPKWAKNAVFRRAGRVFSRKRRWRGRVGRVFSRRGHGSRTLLLAAFTRLVVLHERSWSEVMCAWEAVRSTPFRNPPEWRAARQPRFGLLLRDLALLGEALHWLVARAMLRYLVHCFLESAQSRSC